MKALTLIAFLFLSFAAHADKEADFDEALANLNETLVWEKVTADSGLKSALEESDLKDPFSVRLKGVVTRTVASTGKIYWCGNIMAKNSWGAYGGWRRFYLSLIDGEVSITMTGEEEGPSEFVENMVVNAICKDSPIFIPAD